MELIGVADGGPDLADGITGQFQQFSRLDHAVTDQKFLGRFADGFPEYFAEIAPVEPGALGDVFYGNVQHVVVFNKSQSFLDIEVLDFSFGGLVFPDGSCQGVNEDIEVSDQMKGRLFFILHDIDHLVAHLLFKLPMDRIIDRLIDAQAGDLQGLPGPQTVEFQPAVFPGDALIRDVWNSSQQYSQGMRSSAIYVVIWRGEIRNPCPALSTAVLSRPFLSCHMKVPFPLRM